MKFTPENIFKLYYAYVDYMDDSHSMGEEMVTFISKSSQYDEDQTIRVGPFKDKLTFNFILKGLQEFKAKAQDLEVALALVNLQNCDQKESKVYKKIFEQIMLNDDNLKAFRDSLNKALDFGHSIYHIHGERENEKTLNEVLRIENLEDPRDAFFSIHTKMPDFSDSSFCGRVYHMMPSKLISIYPKLKNVGLKSPATVIDFWYKYQKKVKYIRLDSGEYKREDLIDPLRDRLSVVSDTKMDFMTTIRYRRCIKDYPDFLEKQNDIDSQFLPLVFNACNAIWDAKEKKFFYYPFGWYLKDPQKLINYTGSYLANVAKNVTPDKWFVPYENVDENTKSDLENINMIEGSITVPFPEKIIRHPPQELPAQVVNLFLQAPNILQNLLGSYFDNNGAQIKAVSGVALDKLFDRLDLIQNTTIIKHLESINRVGKVMQKMIPLYYYQERVIGIECEGGQIEFEVINKKEKQPNGMMMIVNDISRITNNIFYKVIIRPSRRLQNQNSQMQLENIYKIMPEAAQNTIDLYANTLELSNKDVLSKRLAANIPLALIEYSKGDINYQQYQQQIAQAQQQQVQQQQQAQQNNPEAQYMQAKAQGEQAKAQTAQFNAETARQKMMNETQTDYLKLHTDAMKYGMENVNTQHEQKLEFYRSMMAHLKDLYQLELNQKDK